MNAIVFKDLVSPNFNEALYDGKTFSYFFSGRNSCTCFIGTHLLKLRVLCQFVEESSKLYYQTLMKKP